jgi:hypothetical protein
VLGTDKFYNLFIFLKQHVKYTRQPAPVTR